MNASVALQAYGQVAQQVAPAQQIVLLYEGMILRLREARRAIEEGRIADRFNATLKVSNIVNALSACLDFEAGGEMAHRLATFYDYVFFKTQAINLHNSVEICDELIANVDEMRKAWQAVAEKVDAPAAPAAPKPVADTPTALRKSISIQT